MYAAKESRMLLLLQLLLLLLLLLHLLFHLLLLLTYMWDLLASSPVLLPVASVCPASNSYQETGDVSILDSDATGTSFVVMNHRMIVCMVSWSLS